MDVPIRIAVLAIIILVALIAVCIPLCIDVIREFRQIARARREEINDGRKKP